MTIRWNLVKAAELPTDRNIRYYAHRYLRRKGNTVAARQKSVTLRAKTITPIEQKLVNELVRIGYAIGTTLFAPINSDNK